MAEQFIAPAASPSAMPSTENKERDDMTNSIENGQNSQCGSEEKASPRQMHGFKWFLAIVGLLASLLLYALDTTIVATIQPAIVTDFGRVDLVPWLAAAFALASAASTLPWSKAYGTFSAKKLFVGGTTLFMASSALCGAAPNINAFIVGRALLGIGGTGMYLGIMTILSVNTSEVERPRYLSMTGFFWGVGTVLGPVVGGAFAESAATWRFAFYINLIVGAAMAPIYIFILPDYHPQPGVPLLERLAQIDYLGALLSACAFMCVMMGMNFGGVLWAWNDGRSIALFVLAVVIFVVWVFQQVFLFRTTFEYRMFPMHFFRNRTMVLIFIIMLFSTFGGFISIYYLPLYFQLIRGATAMETSLYLLPFIIFLSGFVLVNGHFMAKTGYYYPWYIFGAALNIIGGALLYTVDESTTMAKIYGYTIILGAGAGCYAQAGFPVAQVTVDPKDIPYAVGFMTVSQMMGISIGTGMSGALFVNYAHAGLERIFPDSPAADIASAVSGVSSELLAAADAETQARAISAIADALQNAFVPIVVGAAISFLLSLFLKREKLFGGKEQPAVMF
ncbi:hypothetical protein MCOR27_002545 [Pyricularia oryzae]|nr:hypothetical protein MCOR27_002545 [Pyricularia oryzae]KAI6292968.1 hypothetical protein MCOR29_011624 [Pyricularia oryzae]KAI6375493.1 hypothetical protein MCOR31_002161 [Pyricularia oryzae]KAI6380720.1 hypothetical protein MCOR32_003813 [Pyricularia oryzae]KAI6417902.1 hypothetical protein MCOR24_005648 [Pyricularia oryzae]